MKSDFLMGFSENNIRSIDTFICRIKFILLEDYELKESQKHNPYVHGGKEQFKFHIY